ncbi:hypothetical protein OCF63_12290 [Bacillus wiedmannii]|uniref:hypothetical protein n=1 Tax=Bacillus wiedmannii TaxID=1890302 RepID=UPI0021D0E5FC|nr:hypothetical protein [Bacillus wiedmannii]MCU5498775.1 hypothetical protein [Bacillus wiedmannii]
MTNKEMEETITWIRENEGQPFFEQYAMEELEREGFTETEIRYCYVLATGKNITI